MGSERSFLSGIQSLRVLLMERGAGKRQVSDFTKEHGNPVTGKSGKVL